MYDKVVYISGPKRASTLSETRANITAAENEAIWWISNGFAVICPHKNTRDFESIFNVCKVILAVDEELVSRSDIIVMMPCWEASEGSNRERAQAVKKGKVILTKRPELTHVYRVSSPQHVNRSVRIAKGKFFEYPLGAEIPWRKLRYERRSKTHAPE